MRSLVFIFGIANAQTNFNISVLSDSPNVLINAWELTCNQTEPINGDIPYRDELLLVPGDTCTLEFNTPENVTWEGAGYIFNRLNGEFSTTFNLINCGTCVAPSTGPCQSNVNVCYPYVNGECPTGTIDCSISPPPPPSPLPPSSRRKNSDVVHPQPDVHRHSPNIPRRNTPRQSHSPT